MTPEKANSDATPEKEISDATPIQRRGERDRWLREVDSEARRDPRSIVDPGNEIGISKPEIDSPGLPHRPLPLHRRCLLQLAGRIWGFFILVLKERGIDRLGIDKKGNFIQKILG